MPPRAAPGLSLVSPCPDIAVPLFMVDYARASEIHVRRVLDLHSARIGRLSTFVDHDGARHEHALECAENLQKSARTRTDRTAPLTEKSGVTRVVFGHAVDRREQQGSVTRARVDPEHAIGRRCAEEFGLQQAGHQPLRPVLARSCATQASIIHQCALAPEVETPGSQEWVARFEIAAKLFVRRFLIAPPLEDIYQPFWPVSYTHLRAHE